MSSKYVPRQQYLRTREKVYSIADPRPVEAAVLEGGADMMRDMVRQHVRQALAERHEAEEEDDDFLTDEEFEHELDGQPLSEYQLEELAAEIEEGISATVVPDDGDPRASSMPNLPSEPRQRSETGAAGAMDEAPGGAEKGDSTEGGPPPHST